MRDTLINFDQGVALVDLHALGQTAYDRAYCDQLETAFLDLVDQDGLDAVILDGTGNGMPRLPATAGRPSVEDAKRVSAILGLIESFPKPVVAVFDGVCANEGLELALAAHYRICSNSTRFAFNQISLGSIPCFGGTQRLPRLTGAKTALDMFLNAKSLTASRAAEVGLVDQVIEGNLIEQARRHVIDELVAKGPRPTRALVSGKDDPRRYQKQMAEAKTAVAGFKLPAADALVDCVGAAQLMPLETGLSLERSLYSSCETSVEALALRYAMNGERALVRHKKNQPTEVVIAGAGTADATFCVAFLDAGISVSLLPYLEGQVDGLQARIESIYERAVQRRKLTPEMVQQRLSKLTRVSDLSETAAGVILDVGVSSADQLDALTAASGALLLSTRTGQALSELAEQLPDEIPLVGVYFDKSAHVAKCAELLCVTQTSATALDAARAFISQIGKFPVALRQSAPATPVLRKALFDAAENLLLNGAQPRLIDETLTDFGFRKGPLEFRDEIGLEAGFIKDEQPATDALLMTGRSGRSEGLGYYRYAKGDPTPRPDGTILWALSGLRDRLGIKTCDFSGEDVLTLCMGAMMNAGAAMVSRGTVERAPDIDVLSIHNLDFPRRKGGPMRACEDLGLFLVKLCLAEHAHRAPGLWTLDPFVSELIKNGDGFGGNDPLNRVS